MSREQVRGEEQIRRAVYPKSERLTSVFLPLQPEKSPFHQQIACDCRWNGDFSGANRLCGSKLARKNRPKQRDLLGFSGHPKQKRHIIKRIPPPNTAFYADVGNPPPHRPTHQLTTVNRFNAEYVSIHFPTRTVRSHACIKNSPDNHLARSSGLTLRKI